MSSAQYPSTSWTLLHDAHDPQAEADLREASRRELLERYASFARRWLALECRRRRLPEEAADDCFSRLGEQVMRGTFRGARAEQGRFHSYLRRALRNLVIDWIRENRT